MKIQIVLVLILLGALSGCGTSDGPSLLGSEDAKTFHMNFSRSNYRFDEYGAQFKTKAGSNIPNWHGEFFQDVVPGVLEFDSSYNGRVVEFEVDWED